MKNIILLFIVTLLQNITFGQIDKSPVPDGMKPEQIFNLTTGKTSSEIVFKEEMCAPPNNIARFFSWMIVWEKDVVREYSYANGIIYESKPPISKKPYIPTYTIFAVAFSLIVFGFLTFISAANFIFGSWKRKIFSTIFTVGSVTLLTIVSEIFDPVALAGFVIFHSLVFLSTLFWYLNTYEWKIAWRYTFS